MSQKLSQIILSHIFDTVVVIHAVLTPTTPETMSLFPDRPRLPIPAQNEPEGPATDDTRAHRSHGRSQPPVLCLNLQDHKQITPLSPRAPQNMRKMPKSPPSCESHEKTGRRR